MYRQRRLGLLLAGKIFVDIPLNVRAESQPSRWEKGDERRAGILMSPDHVRNIFLNMPIIGSGVEWVFYLKTAEVSGQDIMGIDKSITAHLTRDSQSTPNP